MDKKRERTVAFSCESEIEDSTQILQKQTSAIHGLLTRTISEILSNGDSSFKRCRTDSCDSAIFAKEYEQVTAPENMNWLLDAVAANDGKSLFQLPESFLQSFACKYPPFGFNGLGHMVYLRTYSRIKKNGQNETWVDTVQRVVEGTYEILKAYVVHVLREEWDETKAQESAKEMFTRMFEMKFLPPGRGLWAMGTSIIREKGLGAALNNCAFVSTDDMTSNPILPFIFLMDACMLGVGVGFDTEGADKVPCYQPVEPAQKSVIADTREGWVDSLEALLKSYFVEGSTAVDFDYSQIRPAGLILKTFGGKSSGPDPLVALHNEVRKIMDSNVGSKLTMTSIVDIMNLIGKCVVAGNVRRTAEIAFGKSSDSAFLNLKNYEVNPHRQGFGWTSNNSVFAEVGMDYSEASSRVVANGEPGFAWLSNMQKFSRMNSKPNWRDASVKGGNPCLEQSLESMELCCLVETFPFHHDTFQDFSKSLKYAFLYAKAVTLVGVHWPKTREVMSKNRRIGCSVSGIAQFITARGINTLKEWLEEGYKSLRVVDCNISTWLKIPQSVKLTSVKPSGTISLLAGATPGIHYPESRFYIRRVRMAKNFPLINLLQEAGYHIEPAVGSEETTLVVEVPVDAGDGVRAVHEVSMWEQLSLAAFMQKYWADNQFSATITFDPATEGKQLPRALDYFQYQLKGVSFLPRCEHGAYPQMPYEAIDEERYTKALKRIRPLSTLMSGAEDESTLMLARTKSEVVRVTEQENSTTHKMEDAFCDGGKCELLAMRRAQEDLKVKQQQELLKQQQQQQQATSSALADSSNSH